MNDSLVKDKAVFIVGLLAVFLALGTFKDQLSAIVVPLPDYTLTLWELTLFLLVLLVISGYLYALNYIRYSFGKFQHNKVVKLIFDIILFFANLFYSIALILPLFIIVSSLILSSPVGEFMQKHQKGVWIFDVISGVVFIIPAALNAWFLSKRNKISETKNRGK